ncbi:hypothetical protein L484_018283 [Morus notabilis]|uniref:Uncharacterized protein n=1 Tax=Morus notabilis TaxID=981085 RepID=W9S2P1_9ROSA|nr:hypothetical protein L484_018283 [Morus notabilis]
MCQHSIWVGPLGWAGKASDWTTTMRRNKFSTLPTKRNSTFRDGLKKIVVSGIDVRLEKGICRVFMLVAQQPTSNVLCNGFPS